MNGSGNTGVRVMLAIGILLTTACADGGHLQPALGTAPDTRVPLNLSAQAGKQHRDVMLKHLETVQEIVGVLAREDFETAKGLTETHLGFFMHRQAMTVQRPEDFPPDYHDLAMAHHQAAEELAHIIPTRDLKQILLRLDDVLKACVACHVRYRIADTRH